MTDFHTIMYIINNAIQKEFPVYIRYRDYHGNVTTRMISPLEWVETDKILAYCDLRKEERNFKVRNIIEISQEPISEPFHGASVYTSLSDNRTPHPKAVPVPTPNTFNSSTRVSPFSKVSSTENWQALLSYYRDCLNYEYQHQFSFNKQDLYLLRMADTEAYSFLLGANYLEFRYDRIDEGLINFLDFRNKKNQQLCFGKSFVNLSAGEITPLLFVPINIDNKLIDRLVLKPEEVCLSYASLLKLNFSSEEVSDFIDEYDNFLNREPSMMDLEEYVVTTLSERLTRPLPIFSHEDYSINSITDYSIYAGSGFFWADSRFTGNLITELAELWGTSKWLELPKNLPGLLNQMPEYHHEPAPDFIQDQKFYVTDINTQQRKAAQAVAEHPVTIITGPPGTGKSQLVLNLISQAYLKGQTVLFASHNNKAVDVVMDRLQGEINFQGAIRTGSKENRKRAVEQMENALNQIHMPDISGYQQKYQGGKVQLKNTHDDLHQVRDLLGKILSYQTEKNAVLERIPFAWREKFNQINFPFNETEKNRIVEVLSAYTENFRSFNHQRQKLNDRVQEIFNKKDERISVLKPFLDYELRWGPFAGGILHPQDFFSLRELKSFCIMWQNILVALSNKRILDDLIKTHRGVKQQIETNSDQLDDIQNGVVLEISDKPAEELNSYQEHLVEVQNYLERLQRNQFSWIQKLLLSLRIFMPHKKLCTQIQKLKDEIGLQSTPAKTSEGELTQSLQELDILQLVIFTGELLQREKTLQGKIKQLTTQQTELNSSISAKIVTEFERINLAELSAAPLQEAILEIEHAVEKHGTALSTQLQNAISFFIKNEEYLSIISSLQSIDDYSEVKGTYGLDLDLNGQEALKWAQLWRMAIALWEINAVLNHSQAQLDKLPTEEQVFSAYQNASQSLFQLAGDLMRATWFKRAAETSNEVLEGTKNYISAVKQLNELDFRREREIYSGLKDQERRNFAYAIQMFPIWAITNLTARTNFPLTSELFDLVIVDEASQCDIPSVIPLLYRAKSVVIIGDPNQLRHVSSLNPTLNQQIGSKYGVGLDAYSYTNLSLYDLGARSVGLHPGAILLDEHYRSDPRIITFSNEEFYASQLVLKTDLTRRGYSKEFLNTHGGMSWLNIKGEYNRPPNGGAENHAEFRQIQELVPKLLKALDGYGNKHATLGIVTPFRAQENLFRKWINQAYPNSNRIRSGTAHQFQGDECDVMIFSSVLAEGIQEGTLNWLDSTANLLNVAITRARVSLVIVGDLEFCLNQLPAKSKYHRLAKYVKDRLDQTFSSLEEIPLLFGKKFEILGTLVDPSNPEHNRTTLTRFIASCQEYVYWVDPYFSSEIIDLFDEIYEKEPYPIIKTIRLLTAERQVKYFNGKPPALLPDSVQSLTEYLEEFGVNFEMRVLPGEELPHDRLLYHLGGAINMPPFAGAYGIHRHLSEYTSSATTDETFEAYWKKAIPVEEY